VQLGRIAPVTGAALVFAGLLSVLLFPVLALGLLRGKRPAEPPVPAAIREGVAVG
jgi:hypothetical protein